MLRKNPAEALLGDRIMLARLEASAKTGERVSQERLGLLIGPALGKAAVTAATVSRWESGDALPSLVAVGAIARVCGVDPGWLAFGAETTAPGPVRRRPDSDRHRVHRYLGILKAEELKPRIEKWLRQQGRVAAGRLNKINGELSRAHKMPRGPDSQKRIALAQARLKAHAEWLERISQAAADSLRLAMNEGEWRSPADFLQDAENQPKEPHD
jgi:transcriptional regulator with XRE-family HTH domain